MSFNLYYLMRNISRTALDYGQSYMLVQFFHQYPRQHLTERYTAGSSVNVTSRMSLCPAGKSSFIRRPMKARI